MRPGTLPLLLALWCLGGAIGVIADAVLRGGATFGVFLIVPFVAGSSPLLLLGVVLLVVGFFALSWALAARAGERLEEGTAGSAAPAPGATPPRASYGGFLLIGPVPIVFGNRPGWLPYLVALAAITVVALLSFVLLWTL